MNTLTGMAELKVIDRIQMMTENDNPKPPNPMSKPQKYCCKDCNWGGFKDEVLTAGHPFYEGETIYGCPECKSVQDIRYACDAEGCFNEITGGYPTDFGYKRTCHKHRPKLNEATP